MLLMGLWELRGPMYHPSCNYRPLINLSPISLSWKWIQGPKPPLTLKNIRKSNCATRQLNKFLKIWRLWSQPLADQILDPLVFVRKIAETQVF